MDLSFKYRKTNINYKYKMINKQFRSAFANVWF